MYSAQFRVKMTPRVVVVGAGIAGIWTATRLRNLGFSDVILLEASGEPGGRVAKANLGKSWIDTGAQYIHGASEANPVYCLVKKSGLLSAWPVEEGSAITYTENGTKVEPNFAEDVYDAGEAILRTQGNQSGGSLGKHFAEKALEVVKKWQGDEEMKKRVQSILTLVGKDYLLSIGASDLSNVSLNSWQYFTYMGEDLNIPGKMFQVVDKLLEDFPKDRLLLNRTVAKIEWDGSFCSGNSTQYPVRVVCDDGEEFLTDHVVVTVSLGCLKAQASSLFSPQLSDEKLQAINKLGFGNIAKIFLEYEEAFWDNDVDTINLIWEDDSPDTVHTNTNKWLKSLHYFSVLRPKEKFGNVLLGWCAGDVADLVETMSEDELSCAITEHLRRFTGNSSFPLPKTVMRTQWRINSLTHGAYSFLPTGVDGKVMDTLAEPLSGTKQVFQVMFAGEATIKTQYSTVQGAMLSAQREVERLALHYNKSAPPTPSCHLKT